MTSSRMKLHMQGRMQNRLFPSLQRVAELDDRDLALARKNVGRCRVCTPDSFFPMHQAGEPMLSLYSYSARVQGLLFGVHFDLLQIILCVQLSRSTDWVNPN